MDNPRKTGMKERAGAAKDLLPTLYLAFKHPKTPLLPKLIAGAALLYAFSPIDLLPDFIPFIGMLDDLVIIPLLAGLAIKLIPEEVLKECREKAKGMWLLRHWKK